MQEDNETMHSIAVLAKLPPDKQPKPTMCSHCPNAMWYVTRTRTDPTDMTLHCYCRMMRSDSYDGKEPERVIRECEGIFHRVP